MRIFWFTNTLMPELATQLGRKTEVIGGWMSSLLDGLRTLEGVELAVATIDPATDCLARHDINGVSYFRLPLKRSKVPQLTPLFASACNEAIKSFSPDIIHVHGTEDVYGLFTAQNEYACPTVVSIQGLLHVYCRHVGGGIMLRDALDGGREGLFSWLRFLRQESQWTERGRVERKMIEGNSHFIGRTDWDKAHVLAVNPSAGYFYGGELLRPPFFTAQWDLSRVRRHTLFCTAAHSPLKGFHWLLYAVNLLKQEFPGINVRVAGAIWDENQGFGYYGRYIKRLIEKHGLAAHITPLPALDAEAVARELTTAHAFVIPSQIENSPNSLAEAMLVGTPCVAALIGGIPSMVENEKSALCYPSGDVACLAHAIRRIFQEDTLALSLSVSARDAAAARHSRETIVARQLEVYRLITTARGGQA